MKQNKSSFSLGRAILAVVLCLLIILSIGLILRFIDKNEDPSHIYAERIELDETALLF